MGLLYGGIAAAGYYYFGDGSQQVVTANLKENSPFGSGSSLFDIPGLSLDNAIGGFVLLNAFTTYPALIMIVQDMLWALFSPVFLARSGEGGGGEGSLPPDPLLAGGGCRGGGEPPLSPDAAAAAAGAAARGGDADGGGRGRGLLVRRRLPGAAGRGEQHEL